MSKRKKMIIALIIVAMQIFFNVKGIMVYANIESQQPLLEGPSIEINLNTFENTSLKKDEKGNYSGQINVQSSSGITVVKCFMSGRTGGINGLYEIYISWTGTNQVANIKASSLKITSTSIFSPTTYYNKSFYIKGGSKIMGCKSIGTVYISPSVKKINVKTKGLKCYFNDRDYWISTGNLNGTINLG